MHNPHAHLPGLHRLAVERGRAFPTAGLERYKRETRKAKQVADPGRYRNPNDEFCVQSHDDIPFEEGEWVWRSPTTRRLSRPIAIYRWIVTPSSGGTDPLDREPVSKAERLALRALLAQQQGEAFVQTQEQEALGPDAVTPQPILDATRHLLMASVGPSQGPDLQRVQNMLDVAGRSAGRHNFWQVRRLMRETMELVRRRAQTASEAVQPALRAFVRALQGGLVAFDAVAAPATLGASGAFLPVP